MHRKPRKITRNSGDELNIKRRKKHSLQPEGGETFEAEGQLNSTLFGLDHEKNVEHLRQVWSLLGVGKDGYLTVKELGKVCDYIEMEEMEDEELCQLFAKLDEDNDGRVSFDEFLHGLQHSIPPLTPAPRPLSRNLIHSRLHGSQTLTPGGPRALSSQKKLRFTPDERAVTPVLYTSGEITGLFSVLDPDKTGFALADNIVDLWEKMNISHGADILLALGFDSATKVNLSELSFALEQTLVNDELDAVCQAALATSQQELRHLRSSLDSLSRERDKLRLDLHEANARNTLLAKEVDERHANMEKSTEAKLFDIICAIKETYLNIEQKYQVQIRNLQGMLESEQQTHSAHTAKLKQNLELEMQATKSQQAKMKEELHASQKKLKKLEAELNDCIQKLNDSEGQNMRLQKELKIAKDLQKELSQYVNDEKNVKLELENKELKDKTNDLQSEIENLKQIIGSRRPSRGSQGSTGSTKIPVRRGSSLSDYIKQGRKTSFTSVSSADASEHDDEERKTSEKISKTRRKLPGTPSYSMEDDSGSEQSLSGSLKIELLEKEHKVIEHRFRLEIAQLEEKHNQEKEEILENFEKDKDKLKDEFERKKLEALAEQQKELQTAFVMEKQDLLQRYESEKNLLVHQMTKEKADALNRLKEEQNEELQMKLTQLEADCTKHTDQLQTRASKDQSSVQELQKKQAELELSLKLQQEQLSLDFQKQAKEKEEEFRLQIKELETSHKLEMLNYENILTEGVDALNGKLHEDFYILLNQQVEEQLTVEREKLILEVEEDKANMEAEQKAVLNELDRRQGDVEAEQAAMLDQLSQHQAELEVEHLALQDDLQQQQIQLEARQEAIMNDQQRREDEIEAERVIMLEDLQRLRDNLEAEQETFLNDLKQERNEIKAERKTMLNNLQRQQADLEAEREAVLKDGERLRAELDIERKRMMTDLQKRKDEVQTEWETLLGHHEQQEVDVKKALDEERKEIRESFEEEQLLLMGKYEDQITDLRQQLGDLRERFEAEKKILLESVEMSKENSETDLANDIREELQDEFEEQMTRLRNTFGEEKHEMELKTQLLEEEIIELQHSLQEEQEKSRKVNELQRSEAKLQIQIQQMEDNRTDLKNHLAQLKKESSETRKSLERRIDELLLEKDEAITAVKAEVVQAVSKTHIGKDEHEHLLKERDDLTNELAKARRSNEYLKLETDKASQLQNKHDRLLKEKDDIANELEICRQQMVSLRLEADKTVELQILYQQTLKDKEALEGRLRNALAQGDVMESKKESFVEESNYRHLILEKERLEGQITVLQRKLSETKHVQRDLVQLHEDFGSVMKEKKELQGKVETLQDEMRNSNLSRNKQEKEKIESLQEEKKTLRKLLTKTTNKLMEACTSLAVAQSRHLREIEAWKERTRDMVHLENYTNLQLSLVDQQRHLMELQGACKEKSETMEKILKATEEEYVRKVKVAEGEKKDIIAKLEQSRDLVRDQTEKMKDMYEKSAKRNLLIKDLYTENADLVRDLKVTEERQKSAEKKCFYLERKCASLKRTFNTLVAAEMT